MDRQEEAVLMQRIAASGEDGEVAFSQVVDEFLAPLLRYCRRMMNYSADADDMVQEVFSRVWTDASRFNANTARLTTWLHQIAHNLCIDHFRKHSRMIEQDPTDLDNLINNNEQADTVSAPDELLLADVTADEIRDALDELPERQRSALLLCYYQGLSNRDTAVILGLSVAALESLLARARRGLKQSLNGKHVGV